eukprot:m.20445 g.20445  ORF g.20445 m.20445 type:complete len:706 (+) comp7838_c1_seq1:160-2277(+)
MAGFQGDRADLFDDSLPSEVLMNTLVETQFNSDPRTPNSRHTTPQKRRSEFTVQITSTANAACQTEIMEDLSFLPSAREGNNTKDYGVRGQEGKERKLERKSLFNLRTNKVHPEEALQLDAPRRLQARSNMRRQLGFFGLLLYDLKTWIHLQRTQRRDPVPVWRASIKAIEGGFGTGTASFFVFLRWLFLLNCLMAAFWLALVVLPNVVTFDYGFYITQSFTVDQLLSGRGAVGQSWLFYGAYPPSAGSYRIDMAYVAVEIILLVLCAMLVTHTMVMALSPVHSRGTLVNMDKKAPYSIFIFSSWDHAINERTAVETLRKGIVNAIRDHLHEEQHRKAAARVQLTPTERWKMRLIRIGAWTLWAGLVAGSFVALWYVIQSQDITATGISAYSTVLVFAAVNSAVPMAISLMTKLEQYPALLEMRITIGRSAILRTLTLWAVLYGLYKKTSLLDTQTPTWSASVLTPTEKCAGSVYGQELYRLLLVDTLAFSFTISAYHIGMYRFWFNYKDKLELDISEGVLSLVYRQGIVWVGMVFCPLLPVLGALSNALIFLIYYHLVKRTCRPPKKRWTQNRHNVFFFVFLLVMLVVAIIPLNIALQGYKPNCGPYGSPKYDSMYAFVNVWLQEQTDSTRTFAAVVTNGAFLFPLLVALIGVIYYHRVRLQQWNSHHMELLRELDQLRADKKCLLARGPLQRTQTHDEDESEL